MHTKDYGEVPQDWKAKLNSDDFIRQWNAKAEESKRGP